MESSIFNLKNGSSPGKLRKTRRGKKSNIQAVHRWIRIVSSSSNSKFSISATPFFTSINGTSVRRFSRSAFGRSTGNDVSGHYKRHYFLFLFFFLFFFFFLRRLLFSQKECSDQKTYFAKVARTPKKKEINTFPDPIGHFGAPWWPFWISGHSLTACNAAPPAKSKMAASGPQNGRRSLERCPPIGFWPL